jgi:hypothetical protein
MHSKRPERACLRTHAMADHDLPTILKRHLKAANIDGNHVQEKLQERRLVQIVSYLELVSMKLRHKTIHRNAFRQRLQNEREMAEHGDMLERVAAMRE